jgi:hypothetical protein
MNGCAYDLVFGKETESATFSATTSVNCSTGTEIIVHVYTNASHSTNICTFTVDEATNQEEKGAFVKNIAEGDLTLGGTVNGLHVVRTGFLCGGTSTTNEASLELHGVLSAVNEAKKPVSLSITE